MTDLQEDYLHNSDAAPVGVNAVHAALIQREMTWHELEAHRRHPLDTLFYDPPAFDQVVNCGIDSLHLFAGATVLDLGSGQGKETAILAKKEVTVISLDLSHKQLQRVRRLVAGDYARATVHFVQADAAALPFSQGSIHAIYGKAIIHHLEPVMAAGEIRRVLARSGFASFAEPLDRHPVITLGRRLTPGLRTRDEHPLSLAELSAFANLITPGTEVEGFFLTAPIAYILRLVPGGEPIFQRLHYLLQQIDRLLMARFPWLKRWAWYGLVQVSQAPAQN